MAEENNMRMFVVTAALFAALSLPTPVHAVQTTAVMKECVNCTATQMQTMAKNQPVGYQFDYDLAQTEHRRSASTRSIWTELCTRRRRFFGSRLAVRSTAVRAREPLK